MTTKTSSNSDAMLELAERCEAATEGSVGLNWACHAAKIGKPRPNRDELNEAPDYTRSVDAALTLVPEGWDGALYLATDTHKPEVQLETPAMRSALSMDDERVEGAAATLPLALCAAALRAKARGE